jgi:hypothetical protein
MVTEQVYDHRFSGIDMPIVRFCRRVSNIAQQNGFRGETWMEDGLGEAWGFFVRLPSGWVALLVEFRHLIEHHHELGPAAYVDEIDIAKFGVQALVDEVVTSLGLSQQEIDWIAADESREIALASLARRAARNGAKE